MGAVSAPGSGLVGAAFVMGSGLMGVVFAPRSGRTGVVSAPEAVETPVALRTPAVSTASGATWVELLKFSLLLWSVIVFSSGCPVLLRNTLVPVSGSPVTGGSAHGCRS